MSFAADPQDHARQAAGDVQDSIRVASSTPGVLGDALLRPSAAALHEDSPQSGLPVAAPGAAPLPLRI
ncbi:MAG: hypothetical protein MUF01_13585 [Bryobacterales bacterium]|nr:hypothetical protein [Bryobacterales bacterium]